MTRVRYPSDNAARDEAGCIVTLRRRDDGELHTFHVHGRVTDVLAPALAHYDSSVWVVQAISTPRTVLHDLQRGGHDSMMAERMLLARCGLRGGEWI